MSSPNRWEIVGGKDTGGILVRQGESVRSAAFPTRLSTGAIVEELECINERVHYRLVNGSGPDNGWITTTLKGKILAKRKIENKFDPYKILGVTPDATDSVIKSTYRKASLKVHPDRNPSPEAAAEFRNLTNAKDFLLNPMKRLMYNAKHGLNQKVYEKFWFDWDQIFEEYDPDEDIDEDASVSSHVPAPLTAADARTDILIIGATGITGALACKMMHGQLVPRTWAIVGRDERKLKLLAEKFGSTPFFRGFTCIDTFAGIEPIVRSARIVVDFSGPKFKVGSDVAEACANSGVHYIDNTYMPGDILHAKHARDKVDARAKATGASLVYFCGYATLADFGTWYMVKHFREKYGAPTRRIRVYDWAEGLTFGGTSTQAMVGAPTWDAEVEKLDGSYLLGGLRPCGMREEDKDEKLTDVQSDTTAGMYTAFTAWQDRAIVRCSAGLLDAVEPYGQNFLFKNWHIFPDMQIAQQAAMGQYILRRRYESAVSQNKVAPPGTGLKERMRRECMIIRTFVGEADTVPGDAAGTNHIAHCVVTTGPGDFGEPNECTTLVALQAAHLVLSHVEKGSGELRPGFGTPAFHLAHLGFADKVMSSRGWNMTEIREGAPPLELFQNMTQKTLQITTDS